MIFLCFIQNLTIAGSKEDFKSFFPNKAFVIILDPYIKWNCTRCHAKYNTQLAPTLSVIFDVLMDSYLNPWKK
jgi:hypothetical protein